MYTPKFPDFKLTAFSTTSVFYVAQGKLGFPGGSMVQNLPLSVDDTGSIPGWEDTLEKEMATHSSIIFNCFWIYFLIWEKLLYW